MSEELDVEGFFKYFNDLLFNNFCKIELDIRTGNTVKSAAILKCEANIHGMPQDFAGGRFVEVFDTHHNPLYYLVVDKEGTAIFECKLN